VIKKIEMGEAFGTYGGEERWRERGHLKDLGVDRGLILR